MAERKGKAWDFVQDDIEHVTKLGYMTERTKHELALAELLDRFQKSHLTTEQIYMLGEVIKESYWIGKDDLRQD